MATLGSMLGGFLDGVLTATYNSAEPLASFLGFDPFTVIIFTALLVGGTLTVLAGKDDDDFFKISHGVGLSGFFALWGFVTVDYMKKMKDVEAETYLGQLIGDISGTTVYLFVMFLMLAYASVKLGSKSDFMKKFTGFGS